MSSLTFSFVAFCENLLEWFLVHIISVQSVISGRPRQALFFLLTCACCLPCLAFFMRACVQEQLSCCIALEEVPPSTVAIGETENVTTYSFPCTFCCSQDEAFFVTDFYSPRMFSAILERLLPLGLSAVNRLHIHLFLYNIITTTTIFPQGQYWFSVGRRAGDKLDGNNSKHLFQDVKR